MTLIVGLLFFVLFVCSVLAIVMAAADYDRALDEMGIAQESAHGALLEGVESEKHRLIAVAMKAEREAAFKRMGGDA